MTQDEQKQAVAREAIKYIVDDAVIGVGSGSTANFFIDELAKIKHRIKGTVASSVKTAERLKSHGIYVDELDLGCTIVLVHSHGKPRPHFSPDDRAKERPLFAGASRIPASRETDRVVLDRAARR